MKKILIPVLFLLLVTSCKEKKEEEVKLKNELYKLKKENIPKKSKTDHRKLENPFFLTFLGKKKIYGPQLKP